LSESRRGDLRVSTQVLHAKLILSDGVVYIGSSNLDIRSLNLNYELMLRLEDKTVAVEAREIFERLLNPPVPARQRHVCAGDF